MWSISGVLLNAGVRCTATKQAARREIVLDIRQPQNHNKQGWLSWSQSSNQSQLKALRIGEGNSTSPVSLRRRLSSPSSVRCRVSRCVSQQTRSTFQHQPSKVQNGLGIQMRTERRACNQQSAEATEREHRASTGTRSSAAKATGASERLKESMDTSIIRAFSLRRNSCAAAFCSCVCVAGNTSPAAMAATE